MNPDVAIIGAGVSGIFAAYKFAKEHKNLKVVMFDYGAKWGKRRRQTDGFGGILPNSDGKLYINNLQLVSDITGERRAVSANKQFNLLLKSLIDIKIVKDKKPYINTENKIKKLGFDLQLNNYIQLYPKDIHIILKHMAETIYSSKNITCHSDNEILDIKKEKNHFLITSSEFDEPIKCKKIIMCVGRSGWRWVTNIYNSFGIIKNNNISQFGVRIEIAASAIKEFNKSNCSLIRDDLELGPFSWNGTVIPEDHIDFAISSFRSNEDRWNTDKVSFNLIGNRYFENKGFEQTSRLGQLTFILSNDRILKEKVSNLLTNKNKLSIIPEYNWLPETIQEISKFIPEIITKGYYHVPTILPLIPKINIKSNLETDIDSMFCAGESAGCIGILSAALMGFIAAGEIIK